jgi:hypothetical protein
MADITSPSLWIYGGRDSYPEFNEVVITDNDGKLIDEKTQMRIVLVFMRHRIYPIGSALTLPNSKAGTITAGFLYGYQGDKKITAAVISTSGKRKWLCTSDNHAQDALGAKWVMHQQRWEQRQPWEDYDWPEA